MFRGSARSYSSGPRMRISANRFTKVHLLEPAASRSFKRPDLFCNLLALTQGKPNPMHGQCAAFLEAVNCRGKRDLCDVPEGASFNRRDRLAIPNNTDVICTFC